MRDVQSPLTVEEIIASTTAQLTEKGYALPVSLPNTSVTTDFMRYGMGLPQRFSDKVRPFISSKIYLTM